MAYRIKRYRMDFDGKGVSAAGIFLGTALFLRIVYYFGFGRIFDSGLWEMLVWLILPGILEVTTIALLRAIRFNAPGVYGILGALECLLLIVMCFGYGEVLRTVLGVLAYAVCGSLIFTCSAGWLSKEIATLMLAVTAFVRIVFFDFPGIMRDFLSVEMLLQLTSLCVVLGLLSLTLGIKLPQNRE